MRDRQRTSTRTSSIALPSWAYAPRCARPGAWRSLFHLAERDYAATAPVVNRTTIFFDMYLGANRVSGTAASEGSCEEEHLQWPQSPSSCRAGIWRVAASRSGHLVPHAERGMLDFRGRVSNHDVSSAAAADEP